MYPQQHAPAPRRRKRKGNRLLVALLVVMGCLVVALGAAAVWGVTHQDDPAAPPPAAPAPSSAAPNPSEARPGVDVGAGTPGAPCATDRQGFYFVQGGKTYVCKGPAPYRWRE